MVPSSQPEPAELGADAEPALDSQANASGKRGQERMLKRLLEPFKFVLCVAIFLTIIGGAAARTQDSNARLRQRTAALRPSTHHYLHQTTLS